MLLAVTTWRYLYPRVLNASVMLHPTVSVCTLYGRETTLKIRNRDIGVRCNTTLHSSPVDCSQPVFN